MAPAGNNKHCQEAMGDTFYLTNVVPQVNLCNDATEVEKNCASH